MSCYNGFNVYRRDENGHLTYVDELSDCVVGRRDANVIWQIQWTGPSLFCNSTERNIVFNRELDGKSSSEIFGHNQNRCTNVIYDYMTVENFTKEVMDAAEPYIHDHEKVADGMRADIRAQEDYLASLYKRQAAIKADDDETFNRTFDRYEEHIKKATADLSVCKNQLKAWESDDPDNGDDEMIRIHEIERMLDKLKKVHAEHPDYVIIRFCND